MANRCFSALILVLALLGVSGEQPPTPLLSLLRGLASSPSAGAAAEAAKPSAGGEDSRVVVKLQRATARSFSAAPGDAVSFYVGSIWVGHPEPQELTVLFDTASGHVLLPAAQCVNATCLEHRRYSAQASAAAVAVNTDGHPIVSKATWRDSVNIEFSQIDLGDGDINGELLRDSVCFGAPQGANCADGLGIVAATSMAEAPFRAAPYDGLVGLGLSGLTLDPHFSVLGRLAQGLRPQFSLSLRGPVGELSLGGVGPALSRAAPPQWFPVVRPEEGFWQVAIEAVRVGNITIETCAAGCRGIVDSGASSLGVPSALAARLATVLTAAPVPGQGCQGPELHLDLGGGRALTLRAEDYAGAACASAPQLTPLSLEPAEQFAGALVLGLSVLRRYDTIFDWSPPQPRVGFSLAALRAVRLGSPAPGHGGPGRTSPAGAEDSASFVQQLLV